MKKPIHALLLVGALELWSCGKREPPAPAMAPSSAAADLASSPQPPVRGGVDLANGELHFTLCRSCHTIVSGGADMTGPNLHGVFGRKATSERGYAYSAALRATGWVWDAPHLDHWLTNPRAAVPGTKMSFAGLRDREDRRDLIAWLAVASRR